MEILSLRVRQDTLDAIRCGRQREYSREIRPNTQSKYCDMDENGYVKDIDGVLQPRHYDVVRFECGHESCACKIEESYIELFEDETGNLITYTEKGDEYIAAQIVYILGNQINL